MLFDIISYIIGLKAGGGGGGGDITAEPITLTANGNYTAPSGKAYTPVYVRVPEAEQATPVISVDAATGEISATSTQEAGVVAAGTKNATERLAVQAGKTVTPGAASQTAVAAGRFTTGAVVVEGDANLDTANIKAGVSIFGKTGTFTDDADAGAGSIAIGKTAYVNGQKIIGTAEARFDGTSLVVPEWMLT